MVPPQFRDAAHWPLPRMYRDLSDLGPVSNEPLRCPHVDYFGNVLLGPDGNSSTLQTSTHANPRNSRVLSHQELAGPRINEYVEIRPGMGYSHLRVSFPKSRQRHCLAASRRVQSLAFVRWHVHNRCPLFSPLSR